MAEIYEVKVCKNCPIVNNECLLHFRGGRPPCGMVAEEKFHNLQQLKIEITAVAHDMEVDSKKDCGIELDYYINRLLKLSIDCLVR